MMRLRILELPPEVDNGRTTTPFVIVLDDVTAVNAEFAQQVKEQLGAKGVLVFYERVELDSDSQETWPQYVVSESEQIGKLMERGPTCSAEVNSR